MINEPGKLRSLATVVQQSSRSWEREVKQTDLVLVERGAPLQLRLYLNWSCKGFKVRNHISLVIAMIDCGPFMDDIQEIFTKTDAVLTAG